MHCTNSDRSQWHVCFCDTIALPASCGRGALIYDATSARLQTFLYKRSAFTIDFGCILRQGLLLVADIINAHLQNTRQIGAPHSLQYRDDTSGCSSDISTFLPCRSSARMTADRSFCLSFFAMILSCVPPQAFDRSFRWRVLAWFAEFFAAVHTSPAACVAHGFP